MENHSITHISRVLDLKVVSVSLFVIPNNSGLLIQSNRCDRTKYLCGLPCVVLTVERERESNPTKSDPCCCTPVVTTIIVLFAKIYPISQKLQEEKCHHSL